MPSETSSKTAAWFDDDLCERLTPDILTFFSAYCNLQHEALTHHLHAVHHRAWAIRPYPCVGQWGFLSPKIAKSPAYATVLQRVKDGDLILDFGCCMGQDLRYLAADGAPTHNMYGTDIEPAFWELGYDLFRDQREFGGRFLQSDILDEPRSRGVPPTSSLRQQLHGKVDIVYAGSVFHLWDLDTQIKALKGIVELSKRNSLVVACQLGSVETETKSAWLTGSKPRLFHDVDSVMQLWKRVSEETGTEWKVDARLVDLKVLLPRERDSSWMKDTNRGLLFEAIRAH